MFSTSDFVSRALIHLVRIAIGVELRIFRVFDSNLHKLRIIGHGIGSRHTRRRYVAWLYVTYAGMAGAPALATTGGFHREY